MRSALLLLPLLTASCAPTSVQAPAPAQTPRPSAVLPAGPAATTGGRFSVSVTPLTPVRVNELVSLEVRVCRDPSMGTPAAGVAVWADAAMPAHGHGLNLTPRTTPVADRPGVYRIDGLLFHMPGAWELRIDVRENGREDRAVFGFTL